MATSIVATHMIVIVSTRTISATCVIPATHAIVTTRRIATSTHLGQLQDHFHPSDPGHPHAG